MFVLSGGQREGGVTQQGVMSPARQPKFSVQSLSLSHRAGVSELYAMKLPLAQFGFTGCNTEPKMGSLCSILKT